MSAEGGLSSGRGTGDPRGADSMLPWLRAPLDEALARQRGHALLVQAAPGIGAYEFVLALAQAWLCEAEPAGAPRPCGQCASCRLVASRSHPDLFAVMPEEESLNRGWPVQIDGGRKPSRQIRVDTVRQARDWIVTTPARGRGKVMLLQPAEAMNEVSANALLKILEEPPAGARLLLAAAEPARLLPTVRSRCQTLTLPWPSVVASAGEWLAGQGVAGAEVLLAAAGGQPLLARQLALQGVTAESWSALPRRVMAGDAAALTGWSVPAALDALAKLCHDAMVAAAGGMPRFYPAASVPVGASLARLVAWQRELQRVQRHADHPWNEGLAIEAFVGAAREALVTPSGRPAPRAFDTLGP